MTTKTAFRNLLFKSFLSFIVLFFSFVYFNFYAISQEPSTVWAKQIGGCSQEVGLSLATDGSGNVYTTGYFEGTMDCDPGPTIHNLYSNGGKDIFITKLDASGNFCWGVNIGGSFDDIAYGIDVNSVGTIAVTGSFQGMVDFNPAPGTNILNSSGCEDIFVLSLNSNGIFNWVKQVGGSGPDVGKSVRIDGSGNVITAGGFSLNVDFDPGAGIYNIFSCGSNDAFIMKLNTSGNFVWVNSLGSSWDDMANSVSLEVSGTVLITGYFSGNINVSTTCGTQYLCSNGGSEIFAAKMNSEGNFIWVKGVGGNYNDAGNGITSDLQGNVYITGYFCDAVDFDPGIGICPLVASCNKDIFIWKLDNNGFYKWARKFGGTGNDVGNSIICDNSGSIFSTGYYEGCSDFDPGPGTCFLNSSGSQDIYILKIDLNGYFDWARGFGSVSQDAGYGIEADSNHNITTTGAFRNSVNFNSGYGSANLNAFGSSDIYVLKLGSYCPCTPVQITCQPQNQSVAIGNHAVFSVSVSGTPPFSYQWRKNGCNILGANSNSYITPCISAYDDGSYYSCVISNCNGSGCIISQNAFLNVYCVCNPPTCQVSCISFSNIMPDQMTLSWMPGNGTNRIVVAKANCDIYGLPCDNFNYIASATFGYGSMLAPDEFVVYNGSGSTATVKNLQPNTTYYFRVFEYNCFNPQYLKCSSYGNPAFKKTLSTCSPPGTQAYYIHFSEISFEEMTVHWMNGDGGYRLVVACEGSDIHGMPQHGMHYNANNYFGHGGMLGPGEYVVYNGTGNSCHVKNLKPGTKYWFRVYEYCCNTPQYLCCSAYGNSAWQQTGTYCYAPTNQACDIVFTEVWPTQFTMRWQNGNGEKRIVVASCENEIIGKPVNGHSYIGDPHFGHGAPFGNGEYVVYCGTGNYTTITGLQPGKKYYFRIFEYNCYYQQYLDCVSTCNPYWHDTPLSCSPPTVQASDITFSDETTDKLTVHWKNGNGSRRIVVCKYNSSITKTPVNGTDYYASSIFKNGNYIGAGEYVIYNGNGNSVTVSNLRQGNTYYFKVFEYNCLPPNYLTTSAENNPIGYPFGITFPTVSSISAENILSEQPALQDTFGFYKTNTPYNTPSPIKICADGSTSTLFRVDVSDSEGIGFQICDKNGNIVINGDESSDFSKYGYLNKPTTINANYVEVNYTHPQFLDDQNKLFRELFLKITFNGVPITGISIPVNIYRAPILIVPDLWSNLSKSDSLLSYLIEKNIQTENLIFRLDYNGYSSLSLEENSILIPESIMNLLINARHNNVSSGKVDILGFGIGAVLSRWYLQDESSISYRNNINKLISISAPHKGTQAANLFLDPVALQTKILFNALGYNIDGGGINDLKVNSTANSTLNSSVFKHSSVPLFTINNKISSENVNEQSSDWDKLLFYFTYWSDAEFFNDFNIESPADLCDYVFFNEKNDIFVPDLSQKGGVPHTNIEGIQSSHFDILENQDIYNLLKNKLFENPNDPAKFWKNGFGSSPQLPVRSFILNNNINNLVAENNDTISIISPEEDATYFSGDSVLVTCIGTENINDIFMVGSGGQRIFDFYHSGGDSLSEYIHVPSDFAGQALIYCAGKKNGNIVDYKTVNFNVIPKSQLDSIELSPENILVGTGYTKSFNLYGYYDGGNKIKINGIPGVEGSILDTTVALLTNDMKILGLNEGETKLYVTIDEFEDSLNILVYLAELPHKASFTSNNNSVCQGDFLQFQNTSSGEPDSILWIFEGGIPEMSTADNQFVEYPVSGTYNVTLIAYYNDINDTIILSDFIIVNSLPEPEISISGTSTFCEGETVILTSSNASVYKWNNGEETQSIEVGESGNYFVNITNEFGCSATSDTMTVKFNPILIPEIQIETKDSVVCYGEELSFFSLISNAGENPTLEWYVNGKLQNETSDVFRTNEIKGQAEVYCILKANSACIDDNKVISNFVSVNSMENKEAKIKIFTCDTITCEGENVVLNAVSTNGGENPQFNWFINGEKQEVNSKEISSSSFINNTSIYCQLVSDELCVIDSITESNHISLKVNPVLNPILIIDAPQTTICENEQIEFKAIATECGHFPEFHWFLNGIEQTTDSLIFIPDKLYDGDKIFCIASVDEECSLNNLVISNNIQIKVNPILTPKVTISSSANSIYICDEITFIAHPENTGLSPELRWYINDYFAGTGLQFSTNDLVNGDMIYCRLISNEPCININNVVSNFMTIAVNPLPIPVLSLATDTIFCTNYNGEEFKFKWYYDGEEISDSQFIQCGFYGSGNYYLEVIKGNCTVISNNIAVNCTTGTNDETIFSSLTAYPNPFKDILNIEGILNDSSKSFEVGLYNSMGIKIMKQVINNKENKWDCKFNLSGLPSGIYYVLVNATGEKVQLKVEKITY